MIRLYYDQRSQSLGGHNHYNDVIMSSKASQITSLTIVYSTVYSDADQRKHQSSASLAFVQGIHKWPVMWKMFPFDDVIMAAKLDKPSCCVSLFSIELTVMILKPKYFQQNKVNAKCMLLPWLLKIPGHQQLWYWPRSINVLLFSTRKDFTNLHNLYIEKDRSYNSILCLLI